ncbi:MAG: hypothetical protein AB7K37_08260 [Cyclobacteriaceae bacterium]
MKKLIYTILFAVMTSLAISACTEENIRPQDGGGQTGGGSDDPCPYGCS